MKKALYAAAAGAAVLWIMSLRGAQAASGGAGAGVGPGERLRPTGEASRPVADAVESLGTAFHAPVGQTLTDMMGTVSATVPMPRADPYSAPQSGDPRPDPQPFFTFAPARVPDALPTATYTSPEPSTFTPARAEYMDAPAPSPPPSSVADARPFTGITPLIAPPGFASKAFKGYAAPRFG